MQKMHTGNSVMPCESHILDKGSPVCSILERTVVDEKACKPPRTNKEQPPEILECAKFAHCLVSELDRAATVSKMEVV